MTREQTYTILEFQPFADMRRSWSIFETDEYGRIMATGGAGPFYRKAQAKHWLQREAIQEPRYT